MAYNPANPFSNLMSGAERTFNHLPNQQYAAFNYAYNPYAVNGEITGQHQLLTTDDQGALRVNIGTGINISANITGVTVNVPSSTAVTGVVNVTGNVNVEGFSTLTGQISVLQNQVASLTGVVAAKWQKVSSSGYVGSFSPVSGPSLINKINGVSKQGATSSFILVFDGNTGASNFPVASISTQAGNNFFIDFAEAGVQFNTNLTIVNSTDAISPVNSGPADFFASVIYRQ